MNNTNKTILFVVVFVLLSSLAYAPGTVITNTGPVGYQIETTPYDYVKDGQPFEANFHVFNISNGRPINNATTSCSLHVYNHSGSHVFENNSLHYDSSEGEWKVSIIGSSFKIGSHSWIVYCNSTSESLGGFRSSTFEVTSDGYEHSSDNTTGVIVGIAIFAGLLMCMGAILIVGGKNKP